MIQSINNCAKRIIARLFTSIGYEIKKKYPDIYLHQYESYEHYKSTQIYHNKRKLNQVWADEETLNIVAQRIKKAFGNDTKVFGVCHGTRNGFEQNYLSSKICGDVIGTDISDTAVQFPNSIQWDFHDVKTEWLGRCNFIYSNSLDQSWKPKDALSTWLGQLSVGGLLFIEHTRAHGPEGASEMDPFGVKPEYMPYLLSDWFGHQISIEIIKSIKSNSKETVWLFVLKRIY